MRSYYIESINLWIICVNADHFVDAKTKDAIRKQWRQQVHTAEDVASCLISLLHRLSSLVNQVQPLILKQLSKQSSNQS